MKKDIEILGGIMFIKIILLLVLILINGVFSATEMAFLSINKYKLAKEIKNKNKKAIKIANLLNDSSTFLSAIQIAITLSGFLASAFAAENFASELADIISTSTISKETLTSILVIIITIILSYFTLVLGELVPKKIGLAYSEKIAFSMVDIIDIVIKVCKPFIIILKASTDFIVKLFKVRRTSQNEEEDIKSTITDSNLEELEKQLLLNIFEFNDTTIDKVMTPKNNVISIDINSTNEEILSTIKKYKYTRFPVLENDKIIGILNVKDLVIKQNKDFKLKNYLRRIVTLNNDMIIDDAYLYLNSKYEVMAEVVKNNEFIGIVTIEDIIEELVGNIFDEYDKNKEVK
mgnify:CR=1 FL=1